MNFSWHCFLSTFRLQPKFHLLREANPDQTLSDMVSIITLPHFLRSPRVTSLMALEHNLKLSGFVYLSIVYLPAFKHEFPKGRAGPSHFLPYSSRQQSGRFIIGGSALLFLLCNCVCKWTQSPPAPTPRSTDRLLCSALLSVGDHFPGLGSWTTKKWQPRGCWERPACSLNLTLPSPSSSRVS